MIRLTELRLPLDHDDTALRDAVLRRLGIGPAALRRIAVFRRGYDARNPRAIALVYTLDIETEDEAALLARNPQLRPSPDTTYRAPARAPGGAAAPTTPSSPRSTRRRRSRAVTRASSTRHEAGNRRGGGDADQLF